jgi:pyruvate formate lyase activating enzyme
MASGKDYTVEQLLEQIRKYKHYFGTSGGVTVSGGEPLLQIDFVTKLFKILKAENIHTCIDTSGVLFNPSNTEKFDELLKYTDLILLDIKHINSAKHKSLTGFNNDNILNFAKFLDKHNKPTWIRYVLVPTLTDDTQSLKELRCFLNTLNNVEKIEVLPYHSLGKSKYDKMNLEYSLNHIPQPTKQQIDIANRILKGENK